MIKYKERVVLMWEQGLMSDKDFIQEMKDYRELEQK